MIGRSSAAAQTTSCWTPCRPVCTPHTYWMSRSYRSCEGQNHTTYDACYLALAEAPEAPLYTCDRKLDTDGHDADLIVFPRTH
jgi:hypothetical protein